jgi:glutaredoxin-like protein NrdH
MTLTVTVYTAGPSCMACRQTKRHLEKRHIPYTEIPISSDDNILDAIHYLGFGRAPVVLVATGNGEQSWDGYRPDRIDAIKETA